MNSSSPQSPLTLGAENESPLWITPLLLQVFHQTTYTYEGSVFESYNEAHLQPLDDASQTCQSFELTVDPQASVRDFPDVYHNPVHYIDVPQFHGHFAVTSVSLVQTRPDDRGLLAGTFPKSKLENPLLRVASFEFLQASPHVPLTDKIKEVSASICQSIEPDVFLQAAAILLFVHDHITYRSESTHVDTRPEEVLEHGYGVCQDFAHLMIALCRTQGIPARYVSGYFYNPYRQPDEVEASHAWVEIHLPDYGWKGLDPTHRRLVDTRYIKLATGRDYADVRPLGGTFRGKGTTSMTVYVKVQKVDT